MRRIAIDSPTLAICALLTAAAGVPAFFNIQSNTSFEPDKAALIRSLAAIMVIASVIEILKRRESGSGLSGRQIDGIWKLSGALIIATVASVLLGVDPVTGLWGNYERGMGLLALLAGVAVMWAAYSAAKAGWLWVVVDAVLIGAAVPAVYGLVQVLGYDPVRSGTISFTLGQRAAGSLGNPLFLGDYLLFAVILGLARFCVGPHLRRGPRWGLGLYLVMLASALLATGSRSALFGLLAAAVIFFLAWGQQQGRRVIQLIALLPLLASLLLLLVAWAAPGLLPSRLSDLFASGGTGGQRLLIWQAVVDLFTDQPRLLVFGLGPDSIALKLAPHTPATLAHYEVDWAFRIPDRAHSLPLDLLSHTGLLGLGLWTVFWASLQTRLLPPPSPRLPVWSPTVAQVFGAVLLAGAAALVAGVRAAPLGFVIGLLAGLVVAISLTPLAARRNPSKALNAFLLAALAGHWMLLGFGFPTHAADLVAWILAGLVIAGEGASNSKPAAIANLSMPIRLAGVSAAVFGFSLSAALPRSLLLWLSAISLLFLVAMVFAGTSKVRRDLLDFFVPVASLFPALLFNRSSGDWAWLAYTWLLVWLLAQPILLLTPSERRPWLLMAAAGLALALLLNLPTYGDIAFKSAILHRGESLTPARRSFMVRALVLSPYDHVLAAGIAPTENQILASTASLADPQAQEVARLYESAIVSQPLAPEALAAYAEWLRQRFPTDPAALALAGARFEQLLELSPNDIESRNRLALLQAAAGDVAGAEADLLELLEVDPLYGPTYIHLAALYAQAANKTAARLLLQEAQTRIPWWDEIPRALASLDVPPP